MNKDELARRLGMSLPTLADRIARDPEFPILRRGSKGVAWQFDLDAVTAHLARRSREKAEAERQRQAWLRALPAPQMPDRAPSLLRVPLSPPPARQPPQVIGAAVLEAAAEFGRVHQLPEPLTADLRRRLAAILAETLPAA